MLPQGVVCGCSASEPWSFSLLPSCSQHLGIAIRPHERRDQLDSIYGPIASTRFSWRVEHRRASVYRTVVERLRRPSSEPMQSFRGVSCMESYLKFAQLEFCWDSFCQCLLTTNSLPEHSAGSAEVEWTTSWIHIATFAQVRQELYLISEKNNKRISFCFQERFWLRFTWFSGSLILISWFNIKQCR